MGILLSEKYGVLCFTFWKWGQGRDSSIWMWGDPAYILNTGSKQPFMTVDILLSHSTPCSQLPCFQQKRCVSLLEWSFWEVVWEPPAVSSSATANLEATVVKCWPHKVEEGPAHPQLTLSDTGNQSSASEIWGFVWYCSFDGPNLRGANLIIYK